jgi:hypothetical protein
VGVPAQLRGVGERQQGAGQGVEANSKPSTSSF